MKKIKFDLCKQKNYRIDCEVKWMETKIVKTVFQRTAIQS